MKKLLLLPVLAVGVGQVCAQNRSISGVVRDEKGAAISGASVQVKGSTIGTTTGVDGRFTLNVPSNARTLVVTSLNYTTFEQAIGSENTFAISLSPGNANTIEEVVVTGYGTRRRSEFTGASARVAARDIEQIPIASFEQALQGRAPGLVISSGSGQPGTAATVVIRGNGSINGNIDPLYVLDGVPIEPGVFRSLNPNDFESVDVLKDAAGAGLYGSRGANGVIVITSKKGRNTNGKARLQYRGQMGYSTPPQLLNINMMNTQQRLAYEETILGPGLAPTSNTTGLPGWDFSPNNPRTATLTPAQQATNARLLDSVRGINTFWPEVFTRNAKFQQHEVNASGGTENFNFFTSLSAYNQQGTIIRSDLDRYTFRANLDFKTDRLNVSVRSTAGWSSLSNIESEGGVFLANPIAAAYLELPYRRLRNDAGQVLTGGGLTGSNAYDRLLTTTSVSNQFKGTLGITINYRIWDGLGFRSVSGVDWRNNNSSRFIDPNSFAGRGAAPANQGSYGEGNLENLQLINTTGLTYSKTFGGKHSVNAQLMMEAIRNRTRSNNFTGFGINFRLPNTPAGISPGTAANSFIPTVTGGRTLNGIFSTFALADYTYDKRYSISASLRRDVPSQVPEVNRNNWFYTVGASWNAIQENFMKNQDLFTDLKVRASYGETANANGFTSNFGFITSFGQNNYGGTPGIFPNQLGNPTFRVESQIITNLGVDVAMFKNRLRASVDVYNKQSQNLFALQNLPRETGFTGFNTNVASMYNRGVEFVVAGDVVRKKDLNISLSVNGAFNRNEVTDLGGLNEIPQGTGIIRVGKPLGTHFTVGWAGVDPATGDPIYTDLQGNPTPVFSAANSRADFGTFLPRFTGGATAEVTWKGFDMSMLFTTAQGVQRFNNEAFFYESTNSNIAFNKRVEMLTETWQRPGQVTNYQRIGTPRQFSSKDIQDASFIRFRNLQVGYTFNFANPSKFIRGFRLWAQGQNLWTWTKWQGFDPEENNNIAQYEFPNPRTYTIGVDVNF